MDLGPLHNIFLSRVLRYSFLSNSENNRLPPLNLRKCYTPMQVHMQLQYSQMHIIYQKYVLKCLPCLLYTLYMIHDPKVLSYINDNRGYPITASIIWRTWHLNYDEQSQQKLSQLKKGVSKSQIFQIYSCILIGRNCQFTSIADINQIHNIQLIEIEISFISINNYKKIRACI